MLKNGFRMAENLYGINFESQKFENIEFVLNQFLGIPAYFLISPPIISHKNNFKNGFLMLEYLYRMDSRLVSVVLELWKKPNT